MIKYKFPKNNQNYNKYNLKNISKNQIKLIKLLY